MYTDHEIKRATREIYLQPLNLDTKHCTSDAPQLNNMEKQRKKKKKLLSFSLINGAFFLLCVLRKRKRKAAASKDRNRYLRKGLWVKTQTVLRSLNRHPVPPPPPSEMDTPKGLWRYPRTLLSHSSSLPPPNFTGPCRFCGSAAAPTKPGLRFLKQDVCLRPPSPQINNPQNLISGGRVEVLESHYFHIPYPGALGAPGGVWAGRHWAGRGGCGGNLRLCASRPTGQPVNKSTSRQVRQLG